ncbi:hypothetical protein C5N14_17255 [Micromonospora sp. MW-13]|uniref:hypothetical protein n=1 Tax=Micromonospora sp. MW-13 TaxID=2094022 RepID=UPI000ED01C8F|nr:hypothetical protein [Micromonospora sp. MW-13]RGC67785.1 hypothetical protein C5N14_17255 [Micromonospora sp. MW-13]
MTFRQPARPGQRPADRSESDRLLDAARAARDAAASRPGPAAGREDTAGLGRPDRDPLARLLAAAAGPTRPGELAGEEAALAAFRAARAAPAPTPAQAPRRRRLTVGAVAWIGTLAATATAGVAVAAGTLDRTEEPAPPPAPSTAPVSPTDSGPVTPRPTRSDPGRSPAPTATPGGVGPSTPARPGASSADTRAPGRTTGPGHSGAGVQLPGLCRAYLAKSAAQRESALAKPGFAPLVAAAGGAAEVENFCRDLLSRADSGRPPPAIPATPAGPTETGRRP